jgi:lipoprotein-releasing system permease protein
VNVPFRIARRYLWSRKSKRLIHLVSGISVVVVAAVCAAMIAILSAFNGIEELVEELFSSLDTELAVLPAEGRVIEATWVDSLAAHPGVAWAGGVLEQDVVVRRQGEPVVCTLLGFDVDHAEQTGLAGRLRRGDVLRPDTLGSACGYVGLGVASQLRIPVQPDAPATLMVGAPKRGRSLSSARGWSPDGGLDRLLVLERLSVCGTFSVNADIDARHIIAPLGFAQKVLQRPDQVSRIELVLAPGWSPEELRESIDTRWTEDVVTRTRREKNALIHSTSRAEKWATFAILSFILVVAAFNILAALTMLLLDKRRDISTLSAMGMTPRDIRRVFSWQGFLINAVGAAAGLAIGLTLVWLQDRYGLVRLQGAMVPAYPVSLRTGDVLGVLGLVLGLGGTFSAAMVAYLVRRMAPDAA